MVCKCGCGQETGDGKQYISGHNLRGFTKTPEHCKRISEGQKRAWQTKRSRLPVGSQNHDAYGYIRVKVQEGAGRWDKEHILVMEASLGRQLLKGEMVHHINGIRTDNRISNLFLCKNKAEHSLIEASCQTLVKELYISGLVKFNKERLCYELV